MANKKNIPQVEAPVVEKPEDKIPATVAKKTIPSDSGAMNQHDKVLYASVIQHRKDELKQNGGSAAVYAGLTAIEDATIIDIAVTELVINKNPAALILTANENTYNTFKLLAAEMGVTLRDFSTLPKPTKEQLKLAGIEGTDATDKVVLQIEDKNVSQEAKTKKKAEQAIIDNAKNKDYTKDYTKIGTDDQLKEALDFQLLNPTITNPIERLITTGQFYRSYKEFLASNAENSEAELAKVHKLDIAALLQDVITMVKPTFVLTGFGKRLCTLAEDANSVIPAFCGFKNCLYNKKTKKYKYDDATIAALVRVLIVWYASAKSAEMSEAIKVKEENIKVLKKDEKANAKGIETETKKIAGLKSAITHFTNMISLVTNPSFDVIDNFIAIYNDKANANYISACTIKKEIFNTYYSGVDIPELEFDSALLNVQQRAGIILNLFTEEMLRRSDFSIENIIKLSSEEEQKADEGEGESKNS